MPLPDPPTDRAADPSVDPSVDHAVGPVDVLRSDDPLHAFTAAHQAHRPLALRTAGTAAHPKTILRTTDSWVDSFPHVSDLMGLTADSRVWVPGPLTATMNLFAVAHTAWTGAVLVDDAAEATHAHLTPSTLRRIVQQDPSMLAGVHVVTAGDRLEIPAYDEARAAGVTVSHYYGAAELSFVGWGTHADALRPFPEVEVVARDGELWVRSPFTCLGYREPELHLLRDEQGWTSVGDRGEASPDRVIVHGRRNGITTAGATVLVADIEPVLRRQAHGEVAVVGLPHPDLGEVVTVAYTKREDLTALRTAARDLLAPAQRPRLWVHLDALPLTSAGKIDTAEVVSRAMAARRDR